MENRLVPALARSARAGTVEEKTFCSCPPIRTHPSQSWSSPYRTVGELQALVAVDDGEQGQAKRMTLDDLIDSYLQHLRETRQLSVRTLDGYRQELCLFAGSVGGGTRISKLDRDHVLAFLNRRNANGEPLNPSSRNHKLTVLRGLGRYQVDHTRARKDPTQGIPWVRVPRKEKPSLSMAEYRALLGAVGELHPPWLRRRQRCLVQLLFHTGLRVSELVGLAVNQVDLEEAVLRGLRRKGGHQQMLPLNREVLQELILWLPVRGLRKVVTDRLFIGRTGQGLGVRQVQRQLKELGQQASISISVTPHLLRHTYASELANRGVNLKVIQELMGHADIRTTSHYAHVGFEALRAASERLAEERD